MLKKILTLIITILCIGVGTFFLSNNTSVKNAFVASGIPEILHFQDVQNTAKEIFSAPLRYAEDYVNGNLVASIVVESTNIERVKAGLTPLSSNISLTNAAIEKVSSMFEEQYFEHVSLSGKDVGDLATEAGYYYIVVGENLALGNFKNDDALVKAWMDSPGHRANILNPKFSEIGVAVKKGVFEGRTTWLAVQEFGRPQSSCPSADPALKVSIDRRKASLDREYQSLRVLGDAIAKTIPKNANEQRLRNEQVDLYNKRVEEYKYQSSILSRDVSSYNESVRQFNNCIR